MRKKIISNKLASILIISSLTLGLSVATSCNSQKSIVEYGLTNKINSSNTEKIGNNISSPSRVVEEFMQFVSSGDLEKANIYLIDKNAKENRKKEDNLQENPPNINWADVLKKRSLYLEKILEERIIEDKSIVNVELGIRGLDDKIHSIFYLKKLNSEWRIYDVHLNPGNDGKEPSKVKELET